MNNNNNVLENFDGQIVTSRRAIQTKEFIDDVERRQVLKKRETKHALYS